MAGEVSLYVVPPIAPSSHSLIKALFCGSVSFIVLAAPVKESGGMDETIHHQTATFLAEALSLSEMFEVPQTSLFTTTWSHPLLLFPSPLKQIHTHPQC